jgi:serine phosphatase RsbU (regulator of sigma subunit)
VRSKDELGKLAAAFNQMAQDLEEHQARLLAEEARRRQEEVEKLRLQGEYARKSEELEEARRFQLSLLPKRLPEHPGFALAVSMKTATEVGGDYYDFSTTGDELLAVIGDATGHGARAATMVTVLKSLFSAYAGNGGASLASFLGEAARTVKRMELGRMAMAVTIVRLAGRNLTVSAAGMPPVLVYRRDTAAVEEIDLQGMPLGGLASDYREHCLTVAPGDTILLLSDGLPELPDRQGDPFGYPRVRSVLAEVGREAPDRVITGLLAAADAWTGGAPPRDDITLVAVQVR